MAKFKEIAEAFLDGFMPLDHMFTRSERPGLQSRLNRLCPQPQELSGDEKLRIWNDWAQPKLERLDERFSDKKTLLNHDLASGKISQQEADHEIEVLDRLQDSTRAYLESLRPDQKSEDQPDGSLEHPLYAEIIPEAGGKTASGTR